MLLPIHSYLSIHSKEDYFTPSQPPSQEEVCIKVDLFQKLSRESKEVVEIILNSPREILNEISTPVMKKITQSLLRKGLIKMGWDKKLSLKPSLN